MLVREQTRRIRGIAERLGKALPQAASPRRLRWVGIVVQIGFTSVVLGWWASWWLVLPYLVLMAWLLDGFPVAIRAWQAWIGGRAPAVAEKPATDVGRELAPTEPVDKAKSPSRVVASGHQPASKPARAAKPVRTRKKRTATPAPPLSPAPVARVRWVRVGPGKFVRVEEVEESPSTTADREESTPTGSDVDPTTVFSADLVSSTSTAAWLTDAHDASEEAGSRVEEDEVREIDREAELPHCGSMGHGPALGAPDDLELERSDALARGFHGPEDHAASVAGAVPGTAPAVEKPSDDTSGLPSSECVNINLALPASDSAPPHHDPPQSGEIRPAVPTRILLHRHSPRHLGRALPRSGRDRGRLVPGSGRTTRRYRTPRSCLHGSARPWSSPRSGRSSRTRRSREPPRSS